MQNNPVQFSAGKVIKRTFSLFKKNFTGLMLFSLPMAVTLLVPLILSLFMIRRLIALVNYMTNYMLNSAFSYNGPDMSFVGSWMLRNMIPLLLIVLVSLLVSVVVSYLVLPFMNCAAQRYMGRREGNSPLTPGQAMASLKSRYGKTILLALVAQLYAIGASMVLSMVYGLVETISFVLVFIPVIGWLIMLALGLLTVVLMFLVMIPVLLVYPIAVFEDRWNFEALGRAFRLIFAQPKISIVSAILFGLILTGISAVMMIPGLIVIVVQYLARIPAAGLIAASIIASLLSIVIAMLINMLELAYGYALHEQTSLAEAHAQVAQPVYAPYAPAGPANPVINVQEAPEGAWYAGQEPGPVSGNGEQEG